MIAKLTAAAALAFWLFLAVTFVLRLFGVWGGDPLVPLLGCVFILISSAILAQILEVRKEVDVVKLGTMYNISIQNPGNVDLSKAISEVERRSKLN